MLYFPNTVEPVAETCKLVYVVAAGPTVTGVCPPITPRNPKGIVAERDTDPANPFLLSTTMLVELVIPATTLIE
jgi:hypothetical protein